MANIVEFPVSHCVANGACLLMNPIHANPFYMHLRLLYLLASFGTQWNILRFVSSFFCFLYAILAWNMYNKSRDGRLLCFDSKKYNSGFHIAPNFCFYLNSVKNSTISNIAWVNLLKWFCMHTFSSILSPRFVFQLLFSHFIVKI